MPAVQAGATFQRPQSVSMSPQPPTAAPRPAYLALASRLFFALLATASSTALAAEATG